MDGDCKERNLSGISWRMKPPRQKLSIHFDKTISISWLKAVNRRCTRSPSGIKCACRPSPHNDEPQRAKARNFLMGKVPHVCGMGARSHQEKSRSPCQNISSSAAFGTARTDKKTMGLRQNCSDLFCERERAS